MFYCAQFNTRKPELLPLVDRMMIFHCQYFVYKQISATCFSPLLSAEPCVQLLTKLGEDLGLRIQIEYPVTQCKPIVILSMLGTQPDLKSIILNSHMDVVPVFEEYWTHKPFDAVMDETGRIFGRGTQDMKSVGMQYLGALRYFKRKQITFKRTIHVMFVPEEELGGDGGMADFVHTVEFRNLNIGFTLDEGLFMTASSTFCFNDSYFLIRHCVTKRCFQHFLCRALYLAHHFQSQWHARSRLVIVEKYSWRESSKSS